MIEYAKLIKKFKTSRTNFQRLVVAANVVPLFFYLIFFYRVFSAGNYLVPVNFRLNFNN